MFDFPSLAIERCDAECVRSLLAQVSGHVAAFEAFEVIETLGQPLGSLRVGSATVGQGVGAAAFQRLQTAQITVFWIRQHVCEAGIAARGGGRGARVHTQVHRLIKQTHAHCCLMARAKMGGMTNT